METEIYKEDLYKEEDELKSTEYLGTFRWKRSLKFPLLKELTGDNTKFDYSNITKWKDYLEQRIDFEVEPYIIDALSYPMSIIFALENIRKTNPNINKSFFTKEKTINIVIMGASQKAEARIALESNYFNELFYYIANIRSNNSDSDFKLNLYFVGEEVQKTCSFSAKGDNNNNNNNINNLKENLIYNFYNGNTAEFLKQYALEFTKSNTLFCGLNCGFGAGYLKLSLSWVKDLIKLMKFNYLMLFTYTNNYEDMPGEYALISDVLTGNIILKNEDNAFKSMTTYKNDEDLWSCGNYGYYVVNGCNKDKVNALAKLNDEQLKFEVSNALSKNNIILK